MTEAIRSDAIREDTVRNDADSNKKTAFILMCYGIVAILLILLFTWAKYVKDLSGVTNIPEVAGFTASISLGNDASVVSTALNGLLPGSSSETDEEVINFEINNYYTVSGTEPVVSDLPLEYNITVYTTGNLPIDIYLIAYDDTAGSTDTSEITYTTYTCERMLYNSESLGDGYKYTFYTSDGYEATFKLDGDAEETAAFALGYEWQTATGYVSENMQKEIELLEIRAVVSAGAETYE